MNANLCLAALAALAASVANAQTGTYQAPWDVKKLTDALTAETRKLEPLIAQCDPAKWSDTSAGAAYQPQWKSVRDNIEYFSTAAAKWARNPEKLSAALETYFRMEAMERGLNSLMEGIRKYYSPDAANMLQSAMNENFNNREQLKQYLSDLSVAREQEFQVADREAQRCRGDLARQPAPAPSRRK